MSNLVLLLPDIMEKTKELGGGAMNLFQKIKNSAGKVTDRAQNVVEIGRLNTQITNIEREVGLYYRRMGEVFYEGFQSKDMSKAEKEMVDLARTCGLLLEECDEIKHKIAELKNQRLCQSCGKSVAKDAMFCQFCGSKLPERKETPKSNPVDHSATVEGTTAASSEWSYDGLSDKDRNLADIAKSEEPTQASVNEPPVEASINPEEEAKQQLEFERERKRQEELDRLIATWKENVTPASSSQPPSTYTDIEHNNTYGDTKTCPNCGETIPKHHKWCPNCGSQQ